ncbi:hypothetical protein DSO57_1006142 [Entomophthora muscae]|uniref:Uncharacterized protein n=1 Tax=Entomophthora muscae TaxID=34485 RepID=A0ACC2UGU4_9FUNG|nr:hypothetical protein DSO57_1006142 [Entomophthora muscae]
MHLTNVIYRQCLLRPFTVEGGSYRDSPATKEVYIKELGIGLKTTSKPGNFNPGGHGTSRRQTKEFSQILKIYSATSFPQELGIYSFGTSLTLFLDHSILGRMGSLVPYQLDLSSLISISHSKLLPQLSHQTPARPVEHPPTQISQVPIPFQLHQPCQSYPTDANNSPNTKPYT